MTFPAEEAMVEERSALQQVRDPPETAKTSGEGQGGLPMLSTERSAVLLQNSDEGKNLLSEKIKAPRGS